MTIEYKFIYQYAKLLILLLCCLQAHGKTSDWQRLAQGLQYQQQPVIEEGPFAKLHVFKVDLDLFNIQYCSTQGLTTAAAAAKSNNAIMAFNGAFFSADREPLGLRVQKGKVISKYKAISWWRVLYQHQGKLKIRRKIPAYQLKQTEFAIQAGPRLLSKGKMAKLKAGKANRTAVGIADNGHLLIVISEHAPISTQYLAEFFKKNLNSQYALNLDGGSSSQLYVDINGFTEQVWGFARIPDPICIQQKNQK